MEVQKILPPSSPPQRRVGGNWKNYKIGLTSFFKCFDGAQVDLHLNIDWLKCMKFIFNGVIQ